ncbi:AAA domain-containing protein [Desulfatibacillum aliphaticivorans]|uniref:AAA domain-containing protein n=1 Tax=Desulfatibacillum aliphaticivorans TaxID=218208 RepID=UPI0004015853|nr:AAA domain-containing protein [Desulfatibacillum aliphaticivorans]
MDAEIKNSLINILHTSSTGLSTREIGFRLRKLHLRLPDYQISSLLRDMSANGQVEYSKGLWSYTASKVKHSDSISCPLPALSKETITELNFTGNIATPEPTPPSGTENVYSGRWGLFRQLVSYYRKCINNEEGAEASAFLNDLGKSYIYLRRIGKWSPKPGLHWRITIPIGSHLSGLLNALPSAGNDQSLVLGYPVQATHIKKQNEPDVSIISPVFFFELNHEVSRDGLVVSCSAPRAEVNVKWLEYAFARKPDQQRNFLSACGFINRWRPNDEGPGFEKEEICPDLENLVTALTAFMPYKIRESLNIDSVPDNTIKEPFDTGIYNRAVLMMAKKTRYTASLLNELSTIESESDDVLDQTALRYIFLEGDEENENAVDASPHESVVVDTTPLNAEQRRAISSLINQEISVITGPPGTGKSQVAAAAICNARLRNLTVLFSSRNHKAIDAVVSRLNKPEGPQLIVRTNSKEDPNLKYTFNNAITDILAFPSNESSIEKIGRVREELFEYLEQRGLKATFAHQAIEFGSLLGELEDKMSYLAQGLTEETIRFLNANSNNDKYKAIEKISSIIKSAVFDGSQQDGLSKILALFRELYYFPSYANALLKLGDMPGLPLLPRYPKSKKLSGMALQVSTLDHAAKYASNRNESIVYEAKLKELPPLEEITQEILKLSDRIKELASIAISLDASSRVGLRPGVDRQELDGLRAALNAMRTGLDTQIITMETRRILKKRTPYILESFPCWAVTNLSVKSRIPLIAGMFDLAIVDEASQSDIPSAIPILFRAKRAGAIGDPHQLTHSTKLSTAKDAMLRRNVNIKRVDDARFAYTESSLYNLLAGSKKADAIFLSETYRSANPIADYSNANFYKGRLRVATDCSLLKIPNGMQMGIGWTDVSGEVQSGGGSGCYSQSEVDEVVSIVRTMLLQNHFKGSLGIVTPFRQQANRIRDALFEADAQLFHALQLSDAHVDTSHGFQGDERDVIIFSICGGPDMPAGSRSFLRETGNLFNVAASRARAVLHVVGNQAWARKCGIPHIESLAVPKPITATTLPKTPWHPFESPYEEMFFNALQEAGLEPRPQFPVSSRRLDMALIKGGEKPIKIDIEVDGDCHRNSDGSRKIDDHWRDIQLQGLGWKVMRFWTYQLREDLKGCVDKVVHGWREND